MLLSRLHDPVDLVDDAVVGRDEVGRDDLDQAVEHDATLLVQRDPESLSAQGPQGSLLHQGLELWRPYKK